MVGRVLACAAVALGLLAGSGGAGAAGPLLTFSPTWATTDTSTRIELWTSAKLRAPVVLTLTGPTGAATVLPLRLVSAGHWRAAITLADPGLWKLNVTAHGTLTARTTLRVAPAAASFAPAGGPACAPPSPASPLTHEALGTATTGGLWAIVYGHRNEPTATLDGVVGKQTKIVWRLLGQGAAVFTVTAPDGRHADPVSVQHHGGSSWSRPGEEWGSLFAFTEPGCWRIQVDRDDNAGDLWVLVRS